MGLSWAVNIAERLRQLVADLKIPAAKESPTECVTVSVATATAVPQRESAWEELDLIKAARHALREARQAGGTGWCGPTSAWPPRQNWCQAPSDPRVNGGAPIRPFVASDTSP